MTPSDSMPPESPAVPGSPVALPNPNPAWTPLGIKGFNGGHAWFPSMAFGPQGQPYAAFQDFAALGDISVMKFNASTGMWARVGPPGFVDGAEPELVIHGVIPYVSFATTPSRAAGVMRFVGTSWQAVGGSFSGGAKVRFNAPLVFDDAGDAYVAFDDDGHARKASVVKLVGDTWVSVGPSGFSDGWITFPSMVLIAGTPYVAYNDFDGTPEDLPHEPKGGVVMRFVSGQWEQVGARFTAQFSSSHALAVDADGTLHGAWSDTVRRFDGNEWVSVGDSPFSGGGTGFVLTAAGTRLYAAYSGANGKAVVKTFDPAAAAWATVGGGAVSEGQAWWPSLAADSQGRPALAYGEGGGIAIEAVVQRFE